MKRFGNVPKFWPSSTTLVGGATTIINNEGNFEGEATNQPGNIEGQRFGEGDSVDHFPQYIPGVDGGRTFQMALGFRF